ncbi:MAG: methyltransferase domain-containing protein [Microcoleus sp. SIO2G3]|nr:methyltransferase domain-containing protein [Microcoleus sp. SIO2G3]
MSLQFTYSWEQAVSWLRNQPESQELVRHCYYDDPLDVAAERFSNSEEWLALKELLGKHIPGKVLDLGAGRGISSYAFAKAGCSVTALEPDPSRLVGAKAIQSLVDSTQLPIEIIQEYGETLPFQDNTFDIVYGRAVLHHARNLTQLCQEAARVLKPGGIFIGTREHVISRKEDLQQFLDTHALHSLYGGENAYLLQEYTDAIKSSGLKLKKLISPFDSAINYAPMTQQEFKAMVASILARRTGNTIAGWLASTRAAQQFFSWHLSRKSNIPGRHYSFLSVKK